LKQRWQKCKATMSCIFEPQEGCFLVFREWRTAASQKPVAWRWKTFLGTKKSLILCSNWHDYYIPTTPSHQSMLTQTAFFLHTLRYNVVLLFIVDSKKIKKRDELLTYLLALSIGDVFSSWYPSLFHFRFKTFLIHKSFPPSLPDWLNENWTILQLLLISLFLFSFFSFS